MLVTKGLRLVEGSKNQCWSRTPSLITRRRRLVGEPVFEEMEVAKAGTYEPYPTRYRLHLGGALLIHTRIWWANGLHENLPLVPNCLPSGGAPCVSTIHMLFHILVYIY